MRRRQPLGPVRERKSLCAVHQHSSRTVWIARCFTTNFRLGSVVLSREELDYAWFTSAFYLTTSRIRTDMSLENQSSSWFPHKLLRTASSLFYESPKTIRAGPPDTAGERSC